MAGQTPQSELRTPKLNLLVPLLLKWFSKNARDLPWRRTRDPYAIWISEIMLQQTQVKTVIPYWERWMRELPAIEAVAQASPDKIHKLWEGLGYYTRVRNLQKAAQQILEKHDGRFPQDFDAVLALPGIGRYTAGAICSIAFNQPVPILDGNVIRVLTRIFGIGENPREKKANAQLWQLAGELVARAVPCPPRRGGDTAPGHSFLNQSLMELGALVCTPRQPQCPDCPVKKLCTAFRENRVEALPNPGKRAAATARRFVAFVTERSGRFLVRQRPAGVVNAHLWEFPNVEIGTSVAAGILPAATILAGAAQVLGYTPSELTPLCTVKHSITRYRITLEAFRVRFGGRSSTAPKNLKMGRRGTPPSGPGVWLTPARLDALAWTGAHRKILKRLKSKPMPRPGGSTSQDAGCPNGTELQTRTVTRCPQEPSSSQ